VAAAAAALSSADPQAVGVDDAVAAVIRAAFASAEEAVQRDRRATPVSGSGADSPDVEVLIPGSGAPVMPRVNPTLARTPLRASPLARMSSLERAAAAALRGSMPAAMTGSSSASRTPQPPPDMVLSVGSGSTLVDADLDERGLGPVGTHSPLDDEISLVSESGTDSEGPPTRRRSHGELE
jgi:hypothetical protein